MVYLFVNGTSYFFFDERIMSFLPLGIYFSTIFWMYYTWFQVTVSAIFNFDFFFCHHFERSPPHPVIFLNTSAYLTNILSKHGFKINLFVYPLSYKHFVKSGGEISKSKDVNSSPRAFET